MRKQEKSKWICQKPKQKTKKQKRTKQNEKKKMAKLSPKIPIMALNLSGINVQLKDRY